MYFSSIHAFGKGRYTASSEARVSASTTAGYELLERTESRLPIFLFLAYTHDFQTLVRVSSSNQLWRIHMYCATLAPSWFEDCRNSWVRKPMENTRPDREIDLRGTFDVCAILCVNCPWSKDASVSGSTWLNVLSLYVLVSTRQQGLLRWRIIQMFVYIQHRARYSVPITLGKWNPLSFIWQLYRHSDSMWY